MNAALRLTIVGVDELAPVLPSSDCRDVEVWRDRNGEICAYGYIAEGENWLHFPGLATYRFGNPSDQVTAIAVAPVREGAIRESFRRAVVPLALQALGLEVLHASAILTSDGVVGLCADSGTGKSTIAYGLSQRGYQLWADDAVAFEVSDSGVRAIRLPFKVRLRPDAASSMLVNDQAAGYALTGSDGTKRSERESAPLAALCVLKRNSDHPDGVVIEPLPPSSAFPALLAHAFCFSLLDEERKRCMMERYLVLSAHLPVFEIRFQPGLERLPTILDRIEAVIERVS